MDENPFKTFIKYDRFYNASSFILIHFIKFNEFKTSVKT